MNQFRKADANNSGYLNFEEAQDLCKGLNIELEKEDLRKLFNEANTEKTNAVSKEKGEVSGMKIKYDSTIFFIFRF